MKWDTKKWRDWNKIHCVVTWTCMKNSLAGICQKIRGINETWKELSRDASRLGCGIKWKRRCEPPKWNTSLPVFLLYCRKLIDRQNGTCAGFQNVHVMLKIQQNVHAMLINSIKIFSSTIKLKTKTESVTNIRMWVYLIHTILSNNGENK